MTRLSSFNTGQSINTTIAGTGATFSAVSNAVGTASRLSTAISAGFESGNVMSAIRSINLPAAGEAVGDVMSAISIFGGDANPNDWRVRLSLPNWVSFKNSPVLKPLKDAGGLIFPYTPQINIKSSAAYSGIQTTHTNYTFQSYTRSEPGQIQITAPMHVEDSDQALYWIAAVHYLRSVSKMFAGTDPKAGNPPPIVFLNGYGAYVFKNIPVVVVNATIDLMNDCDYIGTEVVGSAASAAGNIAQNIGGLSDTLGASIPGLSGITNPISTIAGGLGQVGGLLGSFGAGGTVSGGRAYAPTKSSFSVTLQPVYSRDSARKFSLDQFVTGGYINNYYGYI